MRVENWQDILFNEIEAAQSRAFQWGVYDCSIFTFSTVSLILGVPDISERWSGQYKSARGSIKTMRALGWKNLRSMADDILGQRYGNMSNIGRGDVVLGGEKPNPAFGLCVGDHSVFLAPDGITYLPTLQCFDGWPV